MAMNYDYIWCMTLRTIRNISVKRAVILTFCVFQNNERLNVYIVQN